MSATDIDEAKLEAFMGQAVTDMGAIISAPLLVIGEKLGLYKAMAGAGPLTLPGAGRARGRRRALRPRVAAQPGRRRLRRVRRARATRYTAVRRARAGARRRGQPVLHPRRLRLGRLALRRRGAHPRGVQAPATGMGWHEHDHRLFRGTERFFKPGYRAHLVAEWIPALDGVAGEARARRQGRRRRLRPRRLDDHHGRGVPELRVLRLRLPRRVDRAAPASARRRRASRTAVDVRGRQRPRTSRATRLRPRMRLRLPARHGRPGRGLDARARDARRPTARG